MRQAAMVEETPFTEDAQPALLGAVVNRTRLLLVEDQWEVRMGLAFALREHGYVVHEAEDGIDAFDQLNLGQANPRAIPNIDLLVTDLRMPGLDGLGLMARVRELDWAMPIVLVSAYLDTTAAAEARRCGAAALIEKPVCVDRLLHSIDRVMAP
jgi:CheY-like chemotaxis protein